MMLCTEFEASWVMERFVVEKSNLIAFNLVFYLSLKIWNFHLVSHKEFKRVCDDEMSSRLIVWSVRSGVLTKWYLGAHL